MVANAILAPNGRWQGRDQTGQPVQFGKLYTYINQTTTNKTTWQDYQRIQANSNPVILDGKGEANIYWADDDLYTYKLCDANDNLITTQDNYPIVGTNTTNVVEESQTNFCRNSQFYFWYYGTSFSPVEGLGSQNNNDFVCDDWLYKRTSSSYTANITRENFAIDQTDVPANPTYFFRYQATTTPSGETNNRLYQRYKNVRAFAGKAVSVSLYAKSPTSSPVSVYLVQNFGTGGSPSSEVATLVFQETLTTSWQRYNGTITLPSVSGKTVGSNGDDALELRINFPNDVIATIDLCNVQPQEGSTVTPFPEQVLDIQIKELNNRIDNALFTTGDYKFTLKSTADAGWIMCDDSTIGNVNSGAGTKGFYTKALFSLLWTNVQNQYARILNSDGSLGTRGASAEADFNADKRLSLTRQLGRVLGVAGNPSASLYYLFTADAATDQLTIDVANISPFIFNASPISFTTTGTLPAGLSLATTYYAIYIDNTHIKVATTVANAINGVAINITSAGTGVHTIHSFYNSWSLGQFTGEEQHGLITGEIPSHTHTYDRYQVATSGAQLQGGATYDPSYPSTASGATGGSGAHNIFQPTVFQNCMVKL